MELHLNVSEIFYSIQGEGVSIGVPAVFLRLAGCNLTCGGPNTVATKHLEAGATWRCDTIEVWTKGSQTHFKEILLDWEKCGWNTALKNGSHLVITGGEPLLHDENLVDFLMSLEVALQMRPYIEVETNGTLTPSDKLAHLVSQWNVSPKLANSGMPLEKRRHAETIAWFAKRDSANFKFVVSSPQDIQEVMDTYVTPFQIPKSKVLVMPGVDTRKQHLLKAHDLIEVCKRESLRFSPRLQVLFWDKTTGV
jgi:6-pyruvoyltetrahydropterin 2'-reductase